MISHGTHPILECSSKGDKRFSAFYAVVRGKTIEEWYQASKRFEDGTTGLSIKEAKGRSPINYSESSSFYSALWDEYFFHNPDLLKVIEQYKGFSDIFGQEGHVCQASDVWRIYNKNFKGGSV